MKKLIALLCVMCILFSLAGCYKKTQPVTVYDLSGTVIATVDRVDFSDDKLANNGYRSYVLFALNEAAEIISKKYNCSSADATEILFSDGFSLYTTFNPSIYLAIDGMYNDYKESEMPLSCSVIDYNGNVCAVYNGGKEQYAVMKHSPFSTIKPLAVYAPAIENGLIDWSTKIPDKPYKRLHDEAGVLKDWPVNASGGYTYKDTILFECIKESLNTTSVHCLKTLGVENSINFLKESFGMNLEFEQNKLEISNEEEIIGNIAMGYLSSGVTSIDLAGYYQIFGRSGEYLKPHLINKMTDYKGDNFYTYEAQVKKVLRKDTAYIMNRLLTHVVSPGGTGEDARVIKTELFGKTGTGSEDGGNWFVGSTPEYSCAIWHGKTAESKNIAAELFTKVMENMPEHIVTKFAECISVKKGLFCSDSGKLFSSKCSKMHVGYYAANREPSVCDEH